MQRHRDRLRRRGNTDPTVMCDGHQELRDIVIETRADVKHILESLKTGSDKMEKHDTRITALENKESERKGFEKSVKSIATARATIVSLVISGIGVVIAIVAIIWPNKGS